MQNAHHQFSKLRWITRTRKVSMYPVEQIIYIFDALADRNMGTLYTNVRGALPAVSLNGMKSFFVAYD